MFVTGKRIDGQALLNMDMSLLGMLLVFNRWRIQGLVWRNFLTEQISNDSWESVSQEYGV